MNERHEVGGPSASGVCNIIFFCVFVKGFLDDQAATAEALRSNTGGGSTEPR